MSAAPDYLEPVVGWRVWSIVERGGALLLSSVVYDGVWQPGEAMSARCRRSLASLPWARLPLHEPPNYDCVCGVHGVATAGQAVPYLRCEVASGARPIHRVIGRVSLWGRIVEGRSGWRAACGYPASILVPPVVRPPGLGRFLTRGQSADGIAAALRAYGVPVETADSLDLEDGASIPL